MLKLDRLGWTAGFTIKIYGLRLGIRANCPEILKELQTRLPVGWQPDTNPEVDAIFSFRVGGSGSRPNVKSFHLAYCNFQQWARTHDLEMALDDFGASVEVYLAEAARNRVFVHAGVVSWKGSAILIPGRSLSGKSTLVRELVKAGATYFSDEYAVLDLNGRVHPFPIPIGVRTDPLVKQARYPIEFFGGKIGKKAIRVGLILATEYKKGARWNPKRITPGQGVLSMITNTFSTRRDPANALAAIQQTVLTAAVLKGVRGETDEVVDALLNRPWPTL